ncbi:glycosyltransferase family 2 protein [Brevibacillus reuszeri]|uniref:glycosyltransferase family 2 protein n=1 Tax=Brevibacillus reuszeri TaxID=54915 RepID=UPI0013E0E760|nr:glycosyltransferase [Brevibacillus reuszeri]
MSTEVTVILPSYNRYPLNLLTLYSLENQTFDFAKMEVILIDDASTDGTHVLEHYRPPYPFRYIRNTINAGRSKTRNIGIQEAQGEILIFLDAEVIVDPDFVNSHYQRHQTNKKESYVITGKNVNKVYSYLFADFNQSQFDSFYAIAKNSSIVKTRFEQIAHPHRLKKDQLAEMVRQTMQPIQLLTQKDCHSFSNIKLFSTPKKYEKKIIDAFRDDFRLPWISCTTMNHSVRKKLVESIGGFDESFMGHGLEDYEYGFRLFQTGVKFSYDENIYVYHQEHPIDSFWEQDGTKNLILFQQKHPCLDVYLLSLGRIGITDYTFMDHIMREHQAITESNPGRFHSFQKAITGMLKQIPILKAQKQPIANLLQAAGIEENAEKAVWDERRGVEASGYHHLIKLFDLLVHR